MAAAPLPDYDLLNSLFRYEPETGCLFSRRFNREIGYLFVSQTGRYTCIKIGLHRRFVHRVVWKMMTGQDPIEIDHINRDGRDNRWVNLREVTRAQNSLNRNHRRGRNAPKGVTFHRGVWCARITVSGITHQLGSFGNPVQAHHAYASAVKRLHGDYGNPALDSVIASG